MHHYDVFMDLKVGISVVVPVYRSEQTLTELVERISNAIAPSQHEILLIDDASGDGTWNKICTLASADLKVRGIRLSRNSGQHSALLAGVRLAKYSTVVTLDDDLQNPPEEIPHLVQALNSDVDVVYGVSDQVKQSLFRRLMSRFARMLFSSLLDFKIAVSMSAFRAFRTNLRDGFDSSLGPNISIDALLTWSTARFATVNVKHAKRRSGNSHYTLRKLLRFMIDMATGYSTTPLRLATSIGFATIGFGLLLLFYVAGRPLISGSKVPGFPLLASSIIIFSGVQIFLLGVLGEYIGRMHFRVMNKPTYLIAETTKQDRE